ncbi:hypothetical protein HOY82DRAFT_117955 [Tuber indicum]|nr:hypothetical protein HOY82DRAFT_117955 [Tuber indicum]
MRKVTNLPLQSSRLACDTERGSIPHSSGQSPQEARRRERLAPRNMVQKFLFNNLPTSLSYARRLSLLPFPISCSSAYSCCLSNKSLFSLPGGGEHLFLSPGTCAFFFYPCHHTYHTATAVTCTFVLYHTKLVLVSFFIFYLTRE